MMRAWKRISAQFDNIDKLISPDKKYVLGYRAPTPPFILSNSWRNCDIYKR